MITPQTNVTLDEMALRLSECKRVAICGHVNPDGDCIGSTLGLAHILWNRGITADCLYSDGNPPLGLDVLPGYERLILAGEYQETPDAFVMVDAPHPKRLSEQAAAIKAQAPLSFTIDHHAQDTRESDYSYTDPDAASTTQIVWELAKHMLKEIPKEVAECCYCGLMTDTGCFQYQNVNSDTFLIASEMTSRGAIPSKLSTAVFQQKRLPALRLQQIMVDKMHLEHNGELAWCCISEKDIASCGATKGDTESLIDILRSIEGVRVACLLREQGEATRASLRAKDDTDVSAIAKHFSGGGHRAASGFTYQGNIDSALSEVLPILRSILEA